MRKIVLLITGLIVIMGVNIANSYDIGLIPSGAVDVRGQTLFFVDVIFNADAGGNVLWNYGFNLFYDNSELTWNSENTIRTPPPPLSELMGPPYESPADSGLIQNFSGLLLTGTPPTITGSITLASVAFNIDPGLNVPAPDGLVDVWFDTRKGPGGFTIDSNFVPMSEMPISNYGPDAFAPEPISSVLFVTGGAALIVRKYWNRKKKV